MRLAAAAAAALVMAVAATPATAQEAGPAAGVPVLATGDSMMQIVDVYLARRLEAGGRANLVSDARISTGISKTALLNWPRHAAAQVGRHHPRATVVFLGANDGFAMRTGSGRLVTCCGSAWSREYARRARRMIVTYRQGGRARVYWLLLPQARSGFFRRVYPAVNRGIRRAARGLPGVRLIHLNKVFTPRGRYREFIRHRGRRVRARQRDGVHLSRAGASIAASIVARQMGRDRALSAARRARARALSEAAGG